MDAQPVGCIGLCVPWFREAVVTLAGLVLPVLGALPDALIIVVSGLGGTAEEAQEQVSPPCALTMPIMMH